MKKGYAIELADDDQTAALKLLYIGLLGERATSGGWPEFTDVKRARYEKEMTIDERVATRGTIEAFIVERLCIAVEEAQHTTKMVMLRQFIKDEGFAMNATVVAAPPLSQKYERNLKVFVLSPNSLFKHRFKMEGLVANRGSAEKHSVTFGLDKSNRLLLTAYDCGGEDKGHAILPNIPISASPEHSEMWVVETVSYSPLKLNPAAAATGVFTFLEWLYSTMSSSDASLDAADTVFEACTKDGVVVVVVHLSCQDVSSFLTVRRCIVVSYCGVVSSPITVIIEAMRTATVATYLAAMLIGQSTAIKIQTAKKRVEKAVLEAASTITKRPDMKLRMDPRGVSAIMDELKNDKRNEISDSKGNVIYTDSHGPGNHLSVEGMLYNGDGYVYYERKSIKLEKEGAYNKRGDRGVKGSTAEAEVKDAAVGSICSALEKTEPYILAEKEDDGTAAVSGIPDKIRKIPERPGTDWAPGPNFLNTELRLGAYSSRLNSFVRSYDKSSRRNLLAIFATVNDKLTLATLSCANSTDGLNSSEVVFYFPGMFPEYPSLSTFDKFSYSMKSGESGDNVIKWIYNGLVNRITKTDGSAVKELKAKSLSADALFLTLLCDVVRETQKVTKNASRCGILRMRAPLWDLFLTWFLTQRLSHVTAVKTDLPPFKNLFGSSSVSNLKAGSLSSEEVNKMFKGAPDASLISSSYVLKSEDGMAKLTVTDKQLLLAELACYNGENGETETRVFLEPIDTFRVDFPHWQGSPKQVRISSEGGVSAAKRMLYAGLLGRHTVLNGQMALQEPKARRFIKNTASNPAQRNLTAVWIDEFIVGALCKDLNPTYAIKAQITDIKKVDDTHTILVPQKLSGSILDRAYDSIPPPSQLKITPDSDSFIVTGTSSRSDGSGPAFVAFKETVQENVLFVKSASCPDLGGIMELPTNFVDFTSLKDMETAVFKMTSKKQIPTSISLLYVGLMRRMAAEEKYTSSLTANDMLIDQLCEYTRAESEDTHF
ncbi:hypothetical protein FOL47_011243 [Perkinsus chesapeaki]|uniref:Uncharacterized protein n=1 Tax=Perkinsus chesapeaki TaxID=330153 RepID=A0A7J6MMS9_PERCH|nr:hypothetical protein FOL47_011243 [Perkinsus chesapeaki]